MSPDAALPSFPSFGLQELIGFVDAAHANDLRLRRSTTGFAFLFAGGAIVYKSKTQSITATSSTEAEFIAAVHASKSLLYIRYILTELGFPPTGPTRLYIDNASAIKMINARQPTDRSRHIDIQYFALQDWKAQGHLVALHIDGVNNPSDDLTKPLGWVLHARHARRLMGHFPISFSTSASSLISRVSRSGEGVGCVDRGRVIDP